MAQLDTLTVDNRQAVVSPAPTIRYQYREHLGSSTIEANEHGQVISYEEYYPYGASAYRAAASGVDLSLKRYRFTGKERDEETRLDYFGVRYYASWLGRWTSGDTGGFVDGLNLYRYVRNNPVNGVDREGCSTENVEEGLPIDTSFQQQQEQELIIGKKTSVENLDKEPPRTSFTIFVNGLTNVFGAGAGPAGPLREYWGVYTLKEMININNPGAIGGDNFAQVRNQVNSYDDIMFVNGEDEDIFGSRNLSALSSSAERFDDGYRFAEEHYNEIIFGYEAKLLEDPHAQLDMVTHSQGAAYAEGMAAYIADRGEHTVNRMIHLQPAGATLLRIHLNTQLQNPYTVQTRVGFYTYEDPVVNKYGGRLKNTADIEIVEYSWVTSFPVYQDLDSGNSRMDIEVRRNGNNPHFSTTLDFGKTYEYYTPNAHAARGAGRVRANAIAKALKTALRNE